MVSVRIAPSNREGARSEEVWDSNGIGAQSVRFFILREPPISIFSDLG